MYTLSVVFLFNRIYGRGPFALSLSDSPLSVLLSSHLSRLHVVFLIASNPK